MDSNLLLEVVLGILPDLWVLAVEFTAEFPTDT